MLPGLTRTAAQPASIAANTYLGWKWMSAITGICDLRAIAGSASASSWLGQATRTMSQPEAVSSAICCRVALTSAVRVVVIDCTEIGYSEPTPTAPTCSCRVGRRGANGAAGGAGIPRETLTTPVSANCYWGSTTGLMMSATNSSPLHAMNTSATTYATGMSFATSTGPGS